MSSTQTPSRWDRATAHLDDDQRAALRAKLRATVLRPPRLRYVPRDIVPTPKQELFLQLGALEVFYGGAAGPGKSTALLMAALQYVDVPGYSALIVRRTYGDLALPGALMDMSREWLGPTDASYSAGLRTWRFPSGATLTFGHLEHEEVKRRYAGAAFQFVAFDELTQFTESMYRFLFSRIRRPKRSHRGYAPDGLSLEAVPLRMRSASNPGGQGHEWVRRRLVSRPTRADGAVFVPALLSENPHLDVDSYLETLAHLPDVERARLLRGDWTARDAGTLFDRTWFPIVDHAPPRIAAVRYWDLAGTEVSPAAPDPDWTVGLLLERQRPRPRSVEEHDPDLPPPSPDRWTIAHVVRRRTTPARVKALVLQTAKEDGPGVAVVIEQEPGQAGKSQIEEYRRLLRGTARVEGHRPTGDKETRAQLVAGYAESRQIDCVTGAWNTALFDEAEAFPNSGHDDQVDALSGAFGRLAPKGRLRVSGAAGRRVA